MMRSFCSSVNFQSAQPEQMGMVFTCAKCDTRTARYFSKLSYTKGVVLIQCPHCKVRHLIADNMGWFKDSAENIETFLQEQGDKVKLVEDVTEISPADLEALKAAQTLQTKKFPSSAASASAASS